MKTMKLMAAVAALGCAGMAAQAQATVIILGTATGTVTLDSTGAATVPLSTASCGRCRITITAPGATSAVPEFLYTYHVTPYRPSSFTPYDMTVPIPVWDDLIHPGSYFAFAPGGGFMPPRQISGLGPSGERAKAWIVSFNSANVTFGGAPNTAIDYSVTVSAAPEPATWALMILGFGAVGAAMRRRPVTRHANIERKLEQT